MTILTDDERPELPRAEGTIYYPGYGYSSDEGWSSSEDAYTEGQMQAFADAREAAVLAKLAQQEPVAFADGTFNHAPLPLGTPLYAAPVPAVVPEGWKLVPVEPTEEMIGSWHTAFNKQLSRRINSRGKLKPHAGFLESCEKFAYRAMLAAAPEAPKAGT